MSELFEKQSQENEALLTRVASGPLSRRRVLIGGGIGAVAALAAACGGDEGETAATGNATTTTAAGEVPSESERETEADEGAGPVERATGDLGVAQVAAGLEVLAVQTYGAALEAAGSDALGDVPPAVATFVETAMEHHQAHLDAWNEVLLAADLEEVTSPPEDLKATVDDELAAAEDVTGAAEVALMLEQTAAATYLSVIPELEDEAAIDLAASIQPIDMQHVAVLLFVLGRYPVPDTFAQTDMAYEA